MNSSLLFQYLLNVHAAIVVVARAIIISFRNGKKGSRGGRRSDKSFLLISIIAWMKHYIASFVCSLGTRLEGEGDERTTTSG